MLVNRSIIAKPKRYDMRILLLLIHAENGIDSSKLYKILY